MVAPQDAALSGAPFTEGGASKLAPKHDQGVIEHAALTEVFQQSRHGAIHRAALVGESIADVFGGSCAMEIPSPVKELDVPDALFDEATCQEAVVGEARFTGFSTVGLEGGRRFAVDVHHLGHRHLHSEGQLILGDAGGGLGMPELLGLQLVEVAQGVEAHAPHVAVHAGRVRGVEHWVALGTTLNPLINGRKEAVAKGVLAAVGLHSAGDEHYESGQVLVFSPEAIGDPGANGRPSWARRPGVDQQFGRGVVELVGGHRADDAQFVGHGLQVGQGVREPDAALSVTGKSSRRAQELGRS